MYSRNGDELMAVAFIPKSEIYSTFPQVVPCVWDAIGLRYVPASSPRGKFILSTPVKPLEPRPAPVVVKREPATVVKHECGISVPTDIKNQGLCGVLAIAVVTGKTLGEVFSFMARKHKGNWKGSTTHQERILTMKTFGVKFIDLGVPNFLINLERWTKRYALPNKTYMVQTTGHVQVIRNGHIMDQGGCRLVGLSRLKGKKVVNVLEIIE